MFATCTRTAPSRVQGAVTYCCHVRAAIRSATSAMANVARCLATLTRKSRAAPRGPEWAGAGEVRGRSSLASGSLSTNDVGAADRLAPSLRRSRAFASCASGVDAVPSETDIPTTLSLQQQRQQPEDRDVETELRKRRITEEAGKSDKMQNTPQHHDDRDRRDGIGNDGRYQDAADDQFPICLRHDDFSAANSAPGRGSVNATLARTSAALAPAAGMPWRDAAPCSALAEAMMDLESRSLSAPYA